MADIGELDRNKDRFLEYNKYFEEIARDSKLINHTDESRHFVRYELNEVFSAKHDQLKSPFIGLETPDIKIKNEDGQNVQAVWKGAIIIGHGYEKGKFTDRDKALDQCYYIFLKILAKINHDRVPRVRDGKLHHRIVKFDFDNLQANRIFDFFGGYRAGLRFEFELNAQFDLGYYASDWRNVTDPTPQPPLATVTDSGKLIELFNGDKYTCKATAGTLTLKNSNGDTVATYSVPPGSDLEKIAPDGDMTINSTDIGEAGEVPSGGEANLEVVNTEDTNVGALNLDEKWEVPNATATINGVSLGAGGSIPSSGLRDLPVVNPNGDPIGIKSTLPTAAWLVQPSDFLPTINIAISDDTPSYGDTITFTASGDVYDSVNWVVGNETDGYQNLSGNGVSWDVNLEGVIGVLCLVIFEGEMFWNSTNLTSTLTYLVQTDADAYGWYDATDVTDAAAVVENSGKASALIDKLGNIQNIDNSSAVKQPAFAIADANGRDGLRFTLSAGELLSFTAGDVTNYTEVTFLLAMRPTASWTVDYGRLFSTWKQGENDFNGAHSGAWIEALQTQKAGYSNFKHNMGGGLHVFCVRYSQTAGYLKLDVVVDEHVITSEDLTSNGADLGAVIENLRIGYQVDCIFYQLQLFTRILNDAERDAEIMKFCYRLAGTL